MKKITVCVNGSIDLAAWLGLLDSGSVISLNVETVTDEEPAKKSRKSRVFIKGQSTISIVMKGREVGHRFTKEQAAERLRQAGYALGSVNSVIHRLTAHGFIKRIAHNRFEVVKTVPEGYLFSNNPGAADE